MSKDLFDWSIATIACATGMAACMTPLITAPEASVLYWALQFLPHAYDEFSGS